MLDTDSLDRLLSCSWWKPVVSIATIGILAFVLWTLPNWHVFWENISHFSLLWQVPANRTILLFLTIKVSSPLLLMVLAGIIVWIVALLHLPYSDEGVMNTSDEQTRQQGWSDQQMLHRSTLLVKTHMASPQADPLCAFTAHASVPPVTHEPSISSSASHDTFAASRQPDGVTPTAMLPAQEQQHTPLVIQQEPSAAVPVPAAEGPFAVPIAQALQPSAPLLSLFFLKEMRLCLNVPDGRCIVIPLVPHAKRVQLLAYFAWRRGEQIDRDKLVEQIFGWGLSDEEATEDKLSERFESHKKLLRRKIRAVVREQVNLPAGKQLIDPDLDPFVNSAGFWGLADVCCAEDLETIEHTYRVIALARKEGKLVDEVPDEVNDACQRLIASYPGDFLETIIKKFPSEFRSWQGRSSWVRKPFTHYRDYYLDALWYAAEYAWRLGQRLANAEATPAMAQRKQALFGQAAQYYQSYAMYACNTRFDAKVSFGAHGEVGERIGMSERALRRCVVLLGATGQTDLIAKVWSAYSTQMKQVSDHRWQPSKETQADVQAASAQTGAYRFDAKMWQAAEAFASRQERHA